jgi:hypothetical protein
MKNRIDDIILKKLKGIIYNFSEQGECEFWETDNPNIGVSMRPVS